eukprot:scaffold467421_cov23-Prasinocladus_malaysianus.AAC.1
MKCKRFKYEYRYALSYQFRYQLPTYRTIINGTLESLRVQVTNILVRVLQFKDRYHRSTRTGTSTSTTIMRKESWRGR